MLVVICTSLIAESYRTLKTRVSVYNQPKIDLNNTAPRYSRTSRIVAVYFFLDQLLSASIATYVLHLGKARDAKLTGRVGSFAERSEAKVKSLALG